MGVVRLVKEREGGEVVSALGNGRENVPLVKGGGRREAE